MFRRSIFYVHWFLGITIGLVLGLMGATGALLSYEDEIMDLLSNSTPRSLSGAALSPDQLVTRVSAQTGGAVIGELRLSSDPADAVVVRIHGDSKDGHGVTYVDPRTGAVLGTSVGGEFFGTVEQLHRFLALPAAEGEKSSAIGKQATGIATLALIFFGLSGLYLRWPRHPLRWRAWFALDLKKSGRNLFRELHAVIGVWVLPIYLMTALTGLTWSYDWWGRTSMGVLGVEVREGKPGEPAKGALERQRHAFDQASDGGDNHEERERLFGPRMPEVSLDAVWSSFLSLAGEDFGIASISMPRAEEPLRIQRVIRGSPRSGILDTYLFDAATGQLVSTDLNAARSVGKTIGQSMLAFHSGIAFGEGGRLLVMIASVLMPGFLVTGYLLYVARKGTERSSRVAQPVGLVSIGEDADVLVSYATQSGTARKLATLTASAFVAAGKAVKLCSVSELTAAMLEVSRKALFVVSTYGDGEPPDEARGFARTLLSRPANLGEVSFGVLALGDREYTEFCAFGVEVDRWLESCGAKRSIDLVQIDGKDPAGERRWQDGLQQLGAQVDGLAWAPEPFHPWVISTRTHLNPGGSGKMFLVRLAPPDGSFLRWRAGDIAEIRPQNTDAAIERILWRLRLDGNYVVGGDTLRNLLRRSRLDGIARVEGVTPEELGQSLQALPTRDYSIASVSGTRYLDLIVRQVDVGGTLGQGSGWLTEYCPVNGATELRIRANPSFHQPRNCQMILIGSGTGIAGLRAHIQESERDGHWLIFGERSPDHDAILHDEIAGWLENGRLTRFSPAWSRGGLEKRYVQHLMLEFESDIRSWVSGGAVILVCGRRLGMAKGVDDALRHILGHEAVEELFRSGRYRRDIY